MPTPTLPLDPAGKPKRKSKTIWGGVLAVVASLGALDPVAVAGLLAVAGLDVEPDLIRSVLALLAALGGGVAVRGRITATERLR